MPSGTDLHLSHHGKCYLIELNAGNFTSFPLLRTNELNQPVDRQRCGMFCLCFATSRATEHRGANEHGEDEEYDEDEDGSVQPECEVVERRVAVARRVAALKGHAAVNAVQPPAAWNEPRMKCFPLPQRISLV